MKLKNLLFRCFIILMTSRISRVSGRSIDEIIAGASETTNFNLADIEAGTLIHELDMILTLEQYSALQETSSVLSSRPDRRPKRKAVKQTTYRWPNNVIPYKIVSNIFSESHMVQINAAIAEWQNYTCLRFRPAISSDVNYVSIDNGNGCYSYVGMTGGPQTLGLATGCRVKGVIIHEMGHAVGFHHEQNRPDRDDYVVIREANIPANLLYNFKKYPWEAVETHGVPYDYRSVMHYGGTAFSFYGDITIQTKDPKYQNVIGNREGLSFFDIKLANLMYKCSSKCGNIQCPQPGFVGKDCKCWCPGRPVQICGNSNAVQTTPNPITTRTDSVSMCRNMNKYCQPWAEAGYCRTNSYVKMYCREACNTCDQGPKRTVTVCRDVKTNCADMKKRGFCSGFYVNYMRTNCKFTCNFCGGLDDIAPKSNTGHLAASSLVIIVIWFLSVL